ncbi:MAG: PAS-domain containing protein, partial [Vibrio sp.]
SSSRLVLRSALQGKTMQLDEVATIVDEASEIHDFSRGLLQGAIEHISQGISVVDKQLRLVAWNQRYLDLFEYPEGLIQVGRPIAQIISYNAERGLCGDGDPAEHVMKRVEHLKRGTPHTSSRVREDGKVIEVQGNPMPNGGFVMSFTDITNFRNAEKALTEANETLETRVQQRTFELEQLNQKLVAANQEAQQATLEAQQALASKNKLLAAVSHDLMQPLNAARLFASSLVDTAPNNQVLDIAGYLDTALGTAEDLISDLLDMSRLSSGKVQQRISHFQLNDILQPLAAEFSVLAQDQGIEFSVIPTQVQVESDAKLLRRVLQNLLTNAFRYTVKTNPHKKARVVLGVRRRDDRIEIQVIDNGIGIAADKQAEIFEEFTRVDQNRADQGLGLGLSIAQRIVQLLGHQIDLKSWPDQGSIFSVQVRRSHQDLVEIKPSPAMALSQGILHKNVLCVDNDADILRGMQSLLEPWGCEVKLALNLEQTMAILQTQWQPDVILSDYHLDDNQLGLDVLLSCQHYLASDFIGVIISANRSDEVKQKVKSLGFSFLPKPVKPLKIRNILSKSQAQIRK